MKFAMKKPLARLGCADRGGFTLAEVLAALLFMAIVIPVAVHGLQIASRAGEVAQRKAIAARIGERVMTEVVATRQVTMTNQRGTIQEGSTEYSYTTKIEQWDREVLRQLSVEVRFAVQGQDHFVRLATLLDSSQL
jgi:type II secretory pathway pseudopilin PulG